MNKTDLIADWTTIWQSELAAIAQDRETLDTLAASAQLWQATLALMQEAARSYAAEPPSADFDSAGPGPAPRATPAAAASGAGGAAGDEAERLRARVAELERRLAELAEPARPRRRRRAKPG